MANLSYGIASPFLPQILEDKGIDSTWTGLIFGVFAIAAFVASLCIGKVLDKVGHKLIVTIGSILMGLSIFSFNFMLDIDEELSVILLSLALRMVQGAANGMITTASYSFASSAYNEDELLTILGLVEASVGAGCMLGPVIGNFIYTGIGFRATFIAFGTAMVPFTILTILFLQKPLEVKEIRAKI